MHRKYTYEEVKEFVENLDYELISLEHRNNDIKLILKDKIGFYYCCFNFKSLKNKKFIFVGKNNLYSIQNIKLWLKINNPKFILVSDKYIEAKENLLLTDSDGYFYVTTWSKLYNHKCYPNAIDMRNPYIIYNLKLWLKLNNKPFELISDTYEGNDKLIILKDDVGYYYTSRFGDLQQGKMPETFSVSNKFTIQNIKLWCNINNINYEVISNEYLGSDKYLKCRCFICNEEFDIIWDNIKSKKGCPYCAGKKVGLSNCLATKNPELAKEWHPTKNGDLTPYDVTCGNGDEIWWQCNKGHEWQAPIYNRHGNNSGCPYCSGFYASEDYNLLKDNSELCKEWDYNRNEKRPEEYTPNSSESVWWKCEKGHEWPAIIYSRNKDNGNGCPYCSGFYPSKDYNLLKDNPKLCEDWDYKKNDKRPEDYTPMSGQNVYWKCKECGYKWNVAISDRNRKDGKASGCSQCSESKGEKRCREVLTNFNIPNGKQHTFNDLRGIGGGLLRYDIPAFYDVKQTKLRMLIEYDGIFHYEKQYEDDGFETLQIHDKLKNEYCKLHNIKLIRIPYWDFDNIEEILRKELEII